MRENPERLLMLLSGVMDEAVKNLVAGRSG
jgi:hypothetical protein